MRKDRETTLVSDFEQAIRNCAEIAAGYEKGLKALKGNSTLLKVKDNRQLSGSVDIDTCTAAIYPHENRWDYSIGYKDKAYFVEVHPANTSNIKEMILKKRWLVNWLRHKAKDLYNLRKSDAYYWIPSGKIAILKHSPQYRSLAKEHLIITSSPHQLDE